MFNNEEEIRGKLLLPFLKNLGFEQSEISLEKSFSIRLGKNQHVIRGRSDILCKKDGRNLFIIEIKNDQISINEDDINQGISYARLLEENIAPFTIVTNGKTTRIFDSITKKELTGNNISKHLEYWNNDYKLSFDEDLKIKYEALKNFISLSKVNLLIFCKTQVKDRMGSIIGNINSPNSKFVKELYFKREVLQLNFKKFIKSQSSVFGIVGDSGVGKTNSMCWLALNHLNEEFVFFYNAAIISGSPLNYIARDLNLDFSGKIDNEIVLKKLDELGNSANRKVIIFIDAIDESRDSNLSNELSELAYSAGKLNTVKICISCKTNIWRSFLKNKDTENHLFIELNKFHSVKQELDNCPGFLLNKFSEEELKNIIPHYKAKFNLKGKITDSVLQELSNGFFLRIFCEVYRDKEIPKKIDDQELIKKYLILSLEKTDLGIQKGLRVLKKIGRIFLNHEYNKWAHFYDDGIEAEDLLEQLELSVDQDIPEDFFTRNILIKSNIEEKQNITFYYSKIRDYIICFHSYKLNTLSANEFSGLLEKFYINYIGKSALDFYIENASSAHKESLISFKKKKAIRYVKNYNQYLNENFENIKHQFDPNTNGLIGIILPKNLLKNESYALFPIKGAVSKGDSHLIAFENLENPFSRPYDQNPVIQKGVKVVYGTHTSFLIPDQDRVIKSDIFNQLEKLIEKGKISSYNSDTLLLEKVSTILYYHHKKLGINYDIEDFYLPRFEYIYPIDLEVLKTKINNFRVKEYYRRKLNNPQLVQQAVEKALKEEREVPMLNIIGDFPPFEELGKIVELLLRKGYKMIEEHHLPSPDISVDETKGYFKLNKNRQLPEIRVTQFSVDQAITYTKKFFSHLETCYMEFVNYSFPNLKSELEFYSSCPHEYNFYLYDLDILKGGWFGYKPSENGLTFNFKEYETFEIANKRDGINILRGFSIDQIIYNRDPIKTVIKLNTRKVDDYCVLRNWVYKILKEDMEKIFKEYDV